MIGNYRKVLSGFVIGLFLFGHGNLTYEPEFDFIQCPQEVMSHEQSHKMPLLRSQWSSLNITLQQFKLLQIVKLKEPQRSKMTRAKIIALYSAAKEGSSNPGGGLLFITSSVVFTFTVI